MGRKCKSWITYWFRKKVYIIIYIYNKNRKTLKHSLLNRDIRNCGLLSIHDLNDCLRKSGVRISESELRVYYYYHILLGVTNILWI